jgi:AraC-like DNA-binding protein
MHADNCGCAILSPGWSHPRRLLDSSVLIIGVRGHVPIVVGGAAGTGEAERGYVIAPGTVTILPAGRVHYGTRAIDSSSMYYWFHFTVSGSPAVISGSEAARLLGDDGALDGSALLPLQFSLDDPEPFHQYFRELLFEQENPSYTKLKFQIMFQNLVIRLTESVIAVRQPEHSGVGKSSVTYSIVTWMSEHLTDPNLSIKTIAAAIGLNPDYAGRRFREVMGLSVGDYLLRKRIELAVGKLRETNDTVAEIAQDCGFGTVRHFLRQFKAEEGLTPTEVRRRHRTMHVNVL